MILASQNENLGTHSKRRGQPQGRRYGLAYARENLCREQKLAGAEIRNLVIGVPASSKFYPGIGADYLPCAGAGGESVERLFHFPRSALAIHCGGTPSRRWRGRGFALSAVLRLRFNSKTAQYAFHNAIEPSPGHSFKPLRSGVVDVGNEPQGEFDDVHEKQGFHPTHDH